MSNAKEAMLQKGQYELDAAHLMTYQAAFDRTLESVEQHIPVVLFGPPGTGKTKLVADVKALLEARTLLGKFELVQFHRRFSYEDFIEGYVPTAEGGFAERSGIFKAFCEAPSDKPVDLFVIDEMNRAELSSTFGEALFALEDRATRMVRTAHFGHEFRIPENLSLLGTMNTADRNISIIDYALRRRFRFIAVYPDAHQLATWLQPRGFAFEDFSVNDYVLFFKKLNERVRKHPLLGSHMQIGQSLFVPQSRNSPFTSQDIVSNMTEVLLPQLESYFGFGSQKELSSIINQAVITKYLGQTALDFADICAMVSETNGEK